jgi:hypothetical protein
MGETAHERIDAVVPVIRDDQDRMQRDVARIGQVDQPLEILHRADAVVAEDHVESIAS